MSRTIRWSRRVLLLLGCAAGVVAGGLLARTPSPVEEIPPLALPERGPLTGRSTPAMISYPGLIAHSLLPPVAKPATRAPVKKVTGAPPPPALETRLQVTGVFRCTDPEKSRVILLRKADGKQGIYRRGEVVEGTEIVSIGATVELRYEGRLYRACLVAGTTATDGCWQIEPVAPAGASSSAGSDGAGEAAGQGGQ